MAFYIILSSLICNKSSVWVPWSPMSVCRGDSSWDGKCTLGSDGSSSGSMCLEEVDRAGS